MLPQEVFLSHSSEDRTFAASVAALLRRHRVPTWYSETNIGGAQQWLDEIGAALNRCDWFIVLLSPNSVTSMWVKRELSYALTQNRFEDKIIPVLYQDCDYQNLSWVLNIIQRVDCREDFEQGCRDLLRIWGLGYQPV